MRNKYLLDGPFVLKVRLTSADSMPPAEKLQNTPIFARPEGDHLSFKVAISGAALEITPAEYGRG